MENRIYDEQRMGIERSECLQVVLDKLYLRRGRKESLNNETPSRRHGVEGKQLHFNVGLTGGAGRAAGTLFASTDCPFTADVVLLTFPGGALALLFSAELLFDWDCASVDVTVVLDTCRDPDDRLPLDDPGDGRTRDGKGQ